jgi:hypothetical protein
VEQSNLPLIGKVVAVSEQEVLWIALSCILGAALIWHLVFMWFAAADHCALPRKLRDKIVAEMQQAQHRYKGDYSRVLAHFAYLGAAREKVCLG